MIQILCKRSARAGGLCPRSAGGMWFAGPGPVALVPGAVLLFLLTMVLGTTGLAGEMPGGGAGFSTAATAAEKEIARRRAELQEAQTLIREGDAQYGRGELPEAVASYRGAFVMMQPSPNTDAVRQVALAKYENAATEYARQLVDEAEFEQAEQLLAELLGPVVKSQHAPAKRLQERLASDDYYNMALTPEHLANVRKVEEYLRQANGLMDLGDYDGASLAFAQVLAYDRHNVAARRGLEAVDQAISRYGKSGYDHTRSKMLAEVTASWETAVPSEMAPAAVDYAIRVDDPRAVVSAKLDTIVIPRVEFTETPLTDVIEYMRQRSVDLDITEPDPKRKGVGIILKDGGNPDLGRSTKVTLRLTNVPLSVLLKYVTELTGLRYEIESFAVVVAPSSSATGTSGLLTRRFRVPPNFLSKAKMGGAAVDDPFAPQEASGGTDLAPKMTAREFLESRGVEFNEGGFARYVPDTSTLLVRTSPDSMRMVEGIVDASITDIPKQVEIKVRIIDAKQENLMELGFDWLLGPFNVPGSDRVFGAGGTTGMESTEFGNANANFPFVPPNSNVPVGQNPVTAGLRSGDLVGGDSIEELLRTQDVQVANTRRAPGILALAGVFTDPQFQVVLRAIGQQKGIDILAVPSTVAKSNQIASIRVVREFIYPTEYDPPEIPDAFNVGGDDDDDDDDDDDNGGVPNTSPIFPVTPANPTAFETRELGTILEVEPVIGPDNLFVDLNLTPEISDFIGFINYGSPIIAPSVGVMTENEILMPVFETLRETTSVTVLDGQTVVLGGLLQEHREDIEDKVPILGDIPYIGRFFQTSAEKTIRRAIIMFVSVRIIDPAGQPVNEFVVR